MNRRELFRRLAAASAATAGGVAIGRAVDPDVEPVPTRWDFERPFRIDMDVSAYAVGDALDHLGWASGLGPRPLLCVHPREYPTALRVAAAFGGVVQVWAGRFADDEWTWFVAWRGRRVGSIGA